MDDSKMYRKVFLVVAVLAFALWSVPLRVGAVSGELVQNGGFESGDFTGWSPAGGTALPSITSAAHSGNYAANATVTGTGGPLFINLDSPPLRNETYTALALSSFLRMNVAGTGTLSEHAQILVTVLRIEGGGGRSYDMEYLVYKPFLVPPNVTSFATFDLSAHPTDQWFAVGRDIHADAVAVFGQTFWNAPTVITGIEFLLYAATDGSQVSMLVDDVSLEYTATVAGQYVLTVQAGPGGTTSPAPGSYPYDSGTQVQVSAVPSQGYAFDQWALDGSPTGSSNPLTVAMNGAHLLAAAFAPQQPTASVTVTSTPLTGPGFVSVDGNWITTPQAFQWQVGSQHSLYAPDQAYIQAEQGTTLMSGGAWSDGGDLSHTITVPSSPATYSVHYANVAHSLSQGWFPSGVPQPFLNVTCTPPPTDSFWYDNGTVVSCAASGTGFQLDHWALDRVNVGSANPFTVTMNAPHALFTYFSVQYAITSGPSGAGFVVVDGQPVTTPFSSYWVPGSQHTIAANSPVTVGGVTYTFQSWSDGGTQSHTITVPTQFFVPCCVLLNPAPIYLTAAYSSSPQAQYYLTTSASPQFGGSVVPASGWYANGAPVQAAAVPSSRFRFANWTLDGTPIGSANPFVLTMNSNHTLVANFAASGGAVQITVTSSPSAFGFVAVDGSAINTPQTYEWLPGSTHTLSALSPVTSGALVYAFTGWSDGGSQTHPITVPNFAATYTASYAGQPPPSTVVVTVNSGPQGSGFVSVDGVAVTTPQSFDWPTGSTHALSAILAVQCGDGCQYAYSYWSDGGAQTHSYTVPGSAQALTAAFKAQYYVTIQADPGGSAYPDSGWYDAGSQLQLQAVPETNSSFVSWTGAGPGSYTGAEQSATITVSGPITERASFSQASIPEFPMSPAILLLAVVAASALVARRRRTKPKASGRDSRLQIRIKKARLTPSPR